jgi:hypothetical protein
LRFEIAMGEKVGGLIARQVFILDGRLILPLNTMGLSLGAIGTSGFGVFNDIKPSPFDLATAEKMT